MQGLKNISFHRIFPFSDKSQNKQTQEKCSKLSMTIFINIEHVFYENMFKEKCYSI